MYGRCRRAIKGECTGAVGERLKGNVRALQKSDSRFNANETENIREMKILVTDNTYQ